MKILLSEGSSLSARHTLYALGQEHVIDVLDPDPLCQTRFSRFVNRFHRCPPYGKDPLAYLERLQQVLANGDYDVLVPTHEQIYVIAKCRERLQRYAALAVPPFETVDLLQSKVSFSRLLQELELPQPPGRIVTSADELANKTQLPCFVKEPYSTAGRGVHLVQSLDELQALAKRLSAAGCFEDGGALLVQMNATGVQCTAQSVFQCGDLVGFHCFEARAIGVGGMSIARVSVRNDAVRDHVSRLGKHLNWHGALFLDFFFDSGNGPQYIEANPRIGETVNAMLSGVNLAELLVQVSLGGKVDPLPLGKEGVRTHSGFMVLMSAAMRGADRRGLLRESWSWIRRTDLYQTGEDELTRLSDDATSLIPAAAMALQLIARPTRVHRLVDKAVSNYALSEAAVRQIQSLERP